MNALRHALGMQNPRSKAYTPEELLERAAQREAQGRKNAGASGGTVSPPRAGEGNQGAVLPALPAFSGEYFHLTGDFGRTMHERILKKYAGIPAIDAVVFDTQEKIVKGSNPPYVVAVNEQFRELYPGEDIRTVTQAELEQIVQANPDFVRNRYEDSSLVWRSLQEPNEYLARDIHNQFQKQGKVLQLGIPHVIPLYTLALRHDAQSPEKLAFVILPETTYFIAPMLNHESQKRFESSDVDRATGFPTTVREQGSRILYTRNWKDYTIKNSGLVGAYLGRDLGVVSGSEVLSGSGAVGRVVCTAPQALRKKIGAGV